MSLAIKYNDRLKAFYPSVVDCLWGVYIRSIEENASETDVAGDFHHFSAEYFHHNPNALGLYGPLRMRDADKLRPGLEGSESYVGCPIIMPPHNGFATVRRPYCSALLKDDDREYHLYQVSASSILEVWCEVGEDRLISRTTCFSGFGYSIHYKRKIDPKITDDRHLTFRDEAFRAECLRHFYDIVVMAHDETERQKYVSKFKVFFNNMLQMGGDEFHKKVLERGRNLSWSLQGIGLNEIEEWTRLLLEIWGDTALNPWQQETEEGLF